MSILNVPTGISKIDRDDFLASFLDTTPEGNSNTWALIGVGITDYAIAYNPQTDSEKWIIEKNARSDHSSNQKQADATQKCYKGDPVFEFVAKGRDVLNYTTNVLDVDLWNEGTGTNVGKYPAKKQKAMITINNWGGENGECEYSIYYQGDPTVGYVTIAAGVPTFTEGALTGQ